MQSEAKGVMPEDLSQAADDPIVYRPAESRLPIWYDYAPAFSVMLACAAVIVLCVIMLRERTLPPKIFAGVFGCAYLLYMARYLYHFFSGRRLVTTCAVLTDSALTVTCQKWEKSFPLDALVFTMSYSCAASLTVIAATETDYLTMTCSCGYLLNKSGKYVLRPFYAINKRLMDLNPNHINYVRNKRYRKKNPFTVPTNVFEAEFDTPRVTKLIDRLREQYRFR